ncbi:hypothetical protein HHK36_017691 [Tetracentron sinense]|uniref:Uncharacterized protein n=1 Tax=Tetracentron sinense TaxID=13715 RepID=A0A835DDB0_TETSI|nr:hypothetical protein HHK36_017691 [Tetracentron sinense]
MLNEDVDGRVTAPRRILAEVSYKPLHTIPASILAAGLVKPDAEHCSHQDISGEFYETVVKAAPTRILAVAAVS